MLVALLIAMAVRLASPLDAGARWARSDLLGRMAAMLADGLADASTDDNVARASLAGYVHATFPGTYDMAPHHQLLIEHLEAVERGEIKRLMVFMPPRRGKSELVSVRFPAWYLGRNPQRQIIAASNTQRLARKFSRKVRKQILGVGCPWPFPGVQLAAGNQSVDEWAIAHFDGSYMAVGVGSAIAGSGADLLNIDDPFAKREQAESDAFRENVAEWFESDAQTRLSPDGAIILTHTRWHEDDLAGRQLKTMADGGDQWVVLELPEVAEEGRPDALGRKPGEYLWPGRWPAEKTRSIRLTQPFVWWPLYQQRPQAVGGGLYKRTWMGRRFDPAALPAFQLVVLTVDSAFNDDMSADYSAIAVWGATATDLYVLDVWRDRVAYPDLIRAIKAVYTKWVHLKPWPYIENKSSGISARQTLQRESRIPVLKWEPKGSKVSRAQDASRFFAAGRVLLPEGAPWVHDWIEEHCGFPTGTNDDQVDTTSMAVAELTKRGLIPGEPVDDSPEGEKEASDA